MRTQNARERIRRSRHPGAGNNCLRTLPSAATVLTTHPMMMTMTVPPLTMERLGIGLRNKASPSARANRSWSASGPSCKSKA